MKADFYLLSESFNFSDEGLNLFENSIQLLSDDINFIKSNGDKIFKNDNIYNIEISKNIFLYDLYDPEFKINLSRDTRKFLIGILDKSTSTEKSETEIFIIIDNQENSNLCELWVVNGAIHFNSNTVSCKTEYSISDKRSWLKFHRYFLKAFPCNVNHFVQSCDKVFPNLYVHKRIENEMLKMDGGWENFTSDIVKILSMLNDDFPKYLVNRKNYQRIEALTKFSGETGFEISNQGNAKQKAEMTYSFPKSESEFENICCEPHFKLSKSNAKSDSIFYHNRIHFHEGKADLMDGKILIGHIGRHIDFK